MCNSLFIFYLFFLFLGVEILSFFANIIYVTVRYAVLFKLIIVMKELQCLKVQT
jgi:hypothetical protein